MSQFMFFAILLGCLAVAFAISALWQKSRGLALVLALLVPVAAGVLYWHKGAPAALNPANVTPPKTIPEAIAQLERLTQADPKNFGDQATLARAYMAAQKWPEAAAAYRRALALDYQTDLSVEYAEALLRSSPDRRFPPEAVKILEKALTNNPQNERALFFYGLHLRMSGQPAKAAEVWQRLLTMLDPGATTELRKQIDAARAEAGEAPLPAPETLPSVHVRVNIEPTLARAAKPGAVLFVFARGSDGSGPPVAVKRLPVGKFPMEVDLTDFDSPMPTAKLSSQKEVVVAALLSQSGVAKPTSGDLDTEPATVAVAKEAKVEITLDRSVP
jgi:cytochrome c-type biogenesis protein CcmH